MTVRTLDWDSRFFGLRIGRSDLQTEMDCEELSRRNTDWKQQYDLLYVSDFTIKNETPIYHWWFR